MAKKSKITIVIINIIFVIIIVTIPTTILLVRYSNYGRIDELITYEYTPSTPSSIERLNLYVENGNVDIKYTHQPVNYFLKINVNVEMSGSGLNEKSYLDFFNIVWQNTSSPVNFTMELISDSWLDSSKLYIRNVSIEVIIRSDIVFDIITTIKEGNIKLIVPSGVCINNLKVNVTNGNIYYDFYHCKIDGNLTGITQNGNVELDSYDSEYTRNCNWILITEIGNVDIKIYQDKEMCANITGTAVITTGDMKLIYEDTNANIGAKFTFPLSIRGVGPFEHYVGFSLSFLGDVGYLYESFDFPTNSNYNLSFYITGNLFIDIVSD